MKLVSLMGNVSKQVNTTVRRQLSLALAEVVIGISNLVQTRSKIKLSAILSFQTLNIFETGKNCPFNFLQNNWILNFFVYMFLLLYDPRPLCSYPWLIISSSRRTFFPSMREWRWRHFFNPLNPELNPICYLLALLGAHHFLHVSRIRVKLLTFRRLMSFICGAPILDVSRSHTTTQHSR